MWSAFDLLTNIVTIVFGGALLAGYTALAAIIMNDLEDKYFQKEE